MRTFVKYPTGTEPITTWVDPDALMSGNTTREGHMFHYGQVIHTVIPRENGVYFFTLGTGTGRHKYINENMGAWAIAPIHRQLIKEFN